MSQPDNYASAMCSWCKERQVRVFSNGNTTKFCSKDCVRAARAARAIARRGPQGACVVCGKPTEWADHWKVTCSPECRAARSSETMAHTNRKYASERMTLHNPMARVEIREKMSQSLRAIGHRPPVQGGNGRPLTRPQLAMLERLGAGWVAELAIPTRTPRGSGIPASYKADLANEGAMVVVEIDGGSHQSPTGRARDQKKGAVLISLGWTVLRFTNQQVMERLEDCARAVWSTTSRSTANTTSSPTAS